MPTYMGEEEVIKKIWHWHRSRFIMWNIWRRCRRM